MTELYTPEEEKLMMQTLWKYMRKDGSCAAGKSHYKTYGYSLKELYDSIKDPVFLVTQKCIRDPEETFDDLINVITHKLPIENAPQQLLSAREALLNTNLSDQDLYEKAKTIATLPSGSYPWTEYYRIVYYMMLWKLKRKEPAIAIVIVEKMKRLMKALNIDRSILTNAMKEYITFEKLINGMKKGMNL